MPRRASVTLTTIFEEGGQGGPTDALDPSRPAAPRLGRGVARLRRGRRARHRDDRRRLRDGSPRPGQRTGDPAGRPRLTCTVGTIPRPGPPDGSRPRPSWYRPADATDRSDPAAHRRGRATGRPVHPRSAQRAGAGQAPRSPDRRLAGGRDDQGAPARHRPRRRAAPGPDQGPQARRDDPRSRARRAGHRPDRAPEPGRGGSGQGHPRRPGDAVLRLRPDDPDRQRAQGVRGTPGGRRRTAS